MNALLDRIFDEFGLIVSGWSAEYDHALVEAIERSKSRRYSMFWTTLGEPADSAERLITFRHATTVRIFSADAFFRAVADNVVALEKYGTTHPLSIAAAVARLKAYLALPEQNRISVHELITDAANHLCSALAQYREPRNAHSDGAVLLDEMTKLEKHSELLITLVVTGMWWGDDSQRGVWRSVFTRLVSQQDALPGFHSPNLKLYPALLATYAAGIACCGAGNYALLNELLNGAKVVFPDRKAALGAELYPCQVLSKTTGHLLPDLNRHHTPVSDYLWLRLRPLFKDLLPDDSEYEDCFDRFEYLLALNVAFHRLDTERNPWGPVGRFGWKSRANNGVAVYDVVGREAEAAQQDWPLLRAGFFAGDLTRFRELQKYFVETMMPAVAREWLY